MQAIALVSYDQGKTWPEYLTVMNDSASGIIYWEQSIVELSNHRLVSVAWAFRERDGQTLPTSYSISDDGRTFSCPSPTGFLGQTAKMIRLNDDRILCVYRRHDRPGLWANLSEIKDNQWINLGETSLWQGAASGMSGQLTPGEELSSLKFGFPSMILLHDGTIFLVFWCCEQCINNIRWMTIAIET